MTLVADRFKDSERIRTRVYVGFDASASEDYGATKGWRAKETQRREACACMRGTFRYSPC